jgi:hypothetical protein
MLENLGNFGNKPLSWTLAGFPWQHDAWIAYTTKFVCVGFASIMFEHDSGRMRLLSMTRLVSSRLFF